MLLHAALALGAVSAPPNIVFFLADVRHPHEPPSVPTASLTLNRVPPVGLTLPGRQPVAGTDSHESRDR